MSASRVGVGLPLLDRSVDQWALDCQTQCCALWECIGPGACGVYVHGTVCKPTECVDQRCLSPSPRHRDEKVRSLQAELEEQQERLVNGEQLPTVIL